MSIIVVGLDNVEHEFPDGTSSDVIKGAMAKHYGAPKLAGPTPAGPTPNAPVQPQDQLTPRQRAAQPWLRAGRTIAEGIGGAVGGVLALPEAGLAAIPTAGIGGVLTEAAGVGLGAGAGAQAFDIGSKALGFQPKQTVPELAKTTATDVGVNALGAVAGHTLSAGIETMAPYLASKFGVPAEQFAQKMAEQQKKWLSTPQSEEHREAADFLMKKGVRLTPGQQQGGWAKMFWDTNKKANPYVTTALRDLETETVKDVNRAAYQEVLDLSKSGLKVKGDVVGTVGLDRLGKQLSSEYEKVVPNLEFRPDRQIQRSFIGARQQIGQYGKDELTALNADINRYVAKYTKGNVPVKGKMTQEMMKSFEERIDGLATGTNPEKLRAAELQKIYDQIRVNVKAHSANGAGEKYDALDTAWSAYNVLLDAGSRSKNGVFNTGNLITAVKGQGRPSFARGRNQLQDFATKAHNVLHEVDGNPGTAIGNQVNEMMRGRGLIGGALGFGAGGPIGAAFGAGADIALSGATNALIRKAFGQKAAQAITGATAKAPGQLNELVKSLGIYGPRAVAPTMGQQ
jgi:hypothetical protein